MNIKLVRNINLSQKLAITPSLRKSIELLQLSRNELLQTIKDSVNENPFLSKDSDFDDIYSKELDFDSIEEESGLYDYLIQQLNEKKINSHDKAICSAIIYSIDENGILGSEIDEIEEILEFEYPKKDILRNLFYVIHDFDPPGIGARDFKEMIAIQTNKMKIKSIYKEIINEILSVSNLNTYEEIENTLKMKYKQLDIKNALDIIRECDLSPGLNYKKNEFVLPDVEIRKNHNGFKVNFLKSGIPNIAFDSELYVNIKNSKDKPNTKLLEKANEAKSFIRSIDRRNENVYQVAKFICEKQKRFLSKQAVDIEPLAGNEIAKELRLSNSTVSRILKSKYIQYDGGIIPFKSLLVSSVSRSKKVSSTNLIREIEKIIDASKSRISDQMITNILNKKGFNLARRTINKYRKKSKFS